MSNLIEPILIRKTILRSVYSYEMWEFEFDSIPASTDAYFHIPIASSECKFTEFRIYCNSDLFSVYLNELKSTDIQIGHFTVLGYEDIITKGFIDDKLNLFSLNKEPFDDNSGREVSNRPGSRYLILKNKDSADTGLIHVSITIQDLDFGRRTTIVGG